MEDSYINIGLIYSQKVFIRPSDIMYFKDGEWNKGTEIYLKGKKTPIIVSTSSGLILKKLQAHHDMMKLQEENALKDKKVEENV
jgi:hypothetical protein